MLSGAWVIAALRYADSVLRLVGALLILCVFANGAQAQSRSPLTVEEEAKPLITPPKRTPRGRFSSNLRLS